MIFYKNKPEKKFATIAKIEAILESTGGAEGKKATVTLSYVFNGKERVDTVNFWDSQKTKLYTRIKKCSPGDFVAVLISNNGRENTALQFAAKGQYMNVEGKRAFIGEIAHFQQGTTGGKNFTTIGLKCEGAPVLWHTIVFEKHIEAKKGQLVLVTGKDPVEKLTKKGASILTYLGSDFEIIEEEGKNQTVKKNELLITIGVYKRHPVPVDKLLAVPNNDKPRVLSWMRYVADEWEPDENDENLIRQKNAIKKMLSAV